MAHDFLKFSLFLTTMIVFFEYTTTSGQCKDTGIVLLGMRLPCKRFITRETSDKYCLIDKASRCCQTCRQLGYETVQEQTVTSTSTVPTRMTPRPTHRVPEIKTQTSIAPQTMVQNPRTLPVHSGGACSENNCKNAGLCFLENGASQKCACVDYTRGSNCEEKMDTCSQICDEVGDCIYHLKDTALCTCHVPARLFCRVTSAGPTTNELSDAGESTVMVVLSVVSAAMALVMIICCVQFVTTRSKSHQAREAFKASLARGDVPKDLPPNFMAFFCCRGNKAGTEEPGAKQIRRKKSSTSHKKDDTDNKQSEAKKKKKKKKKDKESKKSKSNRKNEKETENQSANSSRRLRAYYFDEDDDTNAFNQNGYTTYNRNVTQGLTKHCQRTDQNRYTTRRSPRHYKYTSTTFPNIKTTDGGIRERVPFLRRSSGCMDRRKFSYHKTDNFDSCNTDTQSYESG